MPTIKTWPSGSGNPSPTVYSIPNNGELNWTTLSSFLQAIADGSQATTFQKYAVRTATSSPVSINAGSDCAIFTNLSVAGPVSVELPAGVAKQVFMIADAKGDAATNNITITPNGSDTIKGGSSLVLNKNYQGVILIYSGTDWNCHGPFLTPGSVTDSDFSGILSTSKGGTGQNSTATFPSSGTVATVPSSGVVKSNGTSLSSGNVSLSAEVSGTLPIGSGGTGQTSQQAALNALAGAVTANRVLRGNGTNIILDQVALSTDVTGTLPTANGGTGVSGTATFPSTGTVATVPSAGVVRSNGSVLSSGTVALGSEVSGTLPTANGGTGVSGTATFPSTGTVATVPSAGVVRSNGSVLSSGTVALGSEVSGTLPIANGGTGQTTANAALNALLPSQGSSANKYLKTDGTNTSWASASGGAGEINAVLNASGADGTTGWTGTSVVTGSNSPLNPIITTAFSISNAATTETSTSGGYYTFTMPTGLYNRKLKVEFSYTTPATDVYKVSVYKGSTRVALSTDSSGSTSLPASVTGGKFVAYFDTDGSSSWTLSVTRTSGSTGPAYITNVIVGPGIQPQGLSGQYLGQLSFTPANLGTITGARYDAWRTGNRLRVVARFTNGTGSGSIASLALPSGYTIDSSALSTSTQSVGTFVALRTSTGTIYGSNAAGVIFYDGSDTSKLYFASNSGAVSGTLNKDTGTAISFVGGAIDVTFEIPIAEWAGSGTVQLAQNDVEYAWNSDPGTAAGTIYSNSAYYGYGPAGSAFRTVVSTTSGYFTTRYRVKFQTPIQSTDQLRIEVTSDGVVWNSLQESADVIPIDASGNYVYGMGILSVSGSTTEVDVALGNGGRTRSETSTIFSAAGQAWGDISNTGRRWRVRKSSAGAAVGFGIVQPGTSAGLVSASGLPGNTTGNAIAAGYVGEVISTSNISSTVTSATQAYPIFASKLLQPGIYLPIVTVLVLTTNSTTLSEDPSIGISTDGSANSWTDKDNAGRSNVVFGSLYSFTASSGLRFGIYGTLKPIVVATATTYYVKDQNRVSSGNLDYSGSVHFVRIA